MHEVCYQSRKHIWAKGQYIGLEHEEGKPYTPAYGREISVDEVEIRSLDVYADLAEVM